jgi:predicted lipoprotein
VRRIAAFVLSSLLVACKVATIRPLAEDGQGQGTARFDAADYVDSIWTSRVVPTVEREATECAPLLSSLKADPEAATRRLGRGPQGRAFLVRGEGRVVSVDRRSRVGLLGLDLMPGDGEPDVWVQIGPVIQGMALRDTVGISFDQFVNQIEYADVGNALNQRVLDSVVKDFDADAAKGTTLSFSGALASGERLVLTPVRVARTQG